MDILGMLLGLSFDIFTSFQGISSVILVRIEMTGERSGETK